MQHIGIITGKTVFGFFIVLTSLLCGAGLWLDFPYNLIPFAVIAGGLFVYLVFKRPMVGVYLYMIIFFFKPNEIWAIPVPYERIIALIIIAVLILYIGFKEKRFELYPLDKALLAFTGVCFLSIMVAGDIELAQDSFEEFLKIVLVYFFCSRIANTESRLTGLVWLYLLSVAFYAGSGIYNYYTGNFIVRMGIERAVALGESYSDPNSLSNSIVIGLPFFFFLIRSHRSTLLKVALFGLVLMCLWTVVITGSRGGMFGVMMVAFVLSMQARQKVVLMGAAVVVLVAFVMVMPGQYKERFMTVFQTDAETGAAQSARGRIDGMVNGLKFMAQSPLIGVGIGNFRWKLRQEEGIWADAHSLIGKVAGELGLLGIITFTLFIVRYVSTLKRIKEKYRARAWPRDFPYWVTEATKVSLIMLLFQGLSGHNLFRFNWYVFACFLVIVAQIINTRIKTAPDADRKEALEAPAVLGG